MATWKKIAYADDVVPTTGVGNVEVLQFDTTPVVGSYSEGKLYYDEVWHTLSAQIGRDVTLQIGQEELRRIYNDTGSQINNARAVYTNGVYTGAEPYVATVALAQSNSISTYWCLGLATQDIPNHEYGFITVRGHVNDIDTSSFSDGDVLYLSSTAAGELTTTIPDPPNYKVRVGRIIKAATAVNHGCINVRLLAALKINDIADVHADAPVAGQLLKFDGVSWVPADTSTVASAGGTDFYLTDSETAIEGMTRAAACVVTWTGHGLATGAYVQMVGITQAGWTALNWTLAAPVFHKITWISVDSFSIPVNTSGYAADYNAAVDNGTISSGKVVNVPVTTIATQTDSAQSTGSVEALLDTYSSAILGHTSIEGGEWAFKTWCYASSTTDTNTIVIRVYKRNTTGTETELFSVETADLGTTTTLSQITSIQPAHAVDVTDHLVFKYYAKSNRGAGSYRTLYMTHNGTTNYSYVKTPLAMSHNQLGGLKGESPYNHLSDAQVTALHAAVTKAAYTDINTGTDDAKFLTSLALTESKPNVHGQTITAIRGTELAPAITEANWDTNVAGWVHPVVGGVLDKSGDGTGTVAMTTPISVTAGDRIEVIATVVVSPTTSTFVAGTIALNIGGISQAIAAVGSYTFIGVATTTAGFTVTNETAARFGISAISVKKLTEGNLTMNGGQIKAQTFAYLNPIPGYAFDGYEDTGMAYTYYDGYGDGIDFYCQGVYIGGFGFNTAGADPIFYIAGSYWSADPTGGTAAGWKLGSVVNNEIEVEVGGDTVKRMLLTAAGIAAIPEASDNATAATAGVAVGGLYHTNANPAVVCIRTA
jgi:hypothetical protein